MGGSPSAYNIMPRFRFTCSLNLAGFSDRLLALESEVAPAADVVLPQDVAWRMFTKGVDGERARGLAVVRGDVPLVSPIFKTVSVIG